MDLRQARVPVTESCVKAPRVLVGNAYNEADEFFARLTTMLLSLPQQRRTYSLVPVLAQYLKLLQVEMASSPRTRRFLDSAPDQHYPSNRPPVQPCHKQVTSALSTDDLQQTLHVLVVHLRDRGQGGGFKEMEVQARSEAGRSLVG